MKDFILTLVVVFIIFRILSSLRNERIRREMKRKEEEQSGSAGFEKDGTRVEFLKKKPEEGEFTDYEIIDDKDKSKEDKNKPDE